MVLRGAFTLCLVIILAHGAMTLVRRIFPAGENRYLDNTTINAAVGTVGGAYALLLSFALSGVWSAYSHTETIVVQEANAIADLDQMSAGFPVPVQREVQEACFTYLRLVINEEWPLMEHGQSSIRADASLDELWQVYTDMGTAEQTSPLYDQSLEQLNALSDDRRERLLAATGSCPPVIMFLLYAGAIATLSLVCLHGMRSIRLHRLLLTTMAAMLTFGLFLINSLNQPFAAQPPISPEPFVFAITHLRHLLGPPRWGAGRFAGGRRGARRRGGPRGHRAGIGGGAVVGPVGPHRSLGVQQVKRVD
jgi:hypothetical protein